MRLVIEIKTSIFIEFDLDTIEINKVSHIKLFTQFSHNFWGLNSFFFVSEKDISCKNTGFISFKFDNGKNFVLKKEVRVID